MWDALSLISGRQRGLAAAVARSGLWLASFPYGVVVRVRNLAFSQGWKRSFSAGVPVVSVGNLTAGGTGKTPMVCCLAQEFRRRGVRVALVSRGYGAGNDSANDEARELEIRLPDVPHVQNPNRVAAASVAVEELASQLIVLDDGFQHRRLRRDLDIVLIDATNPFGYGFLLPRGLLREPLAGLRRSSLIILTRVNLVSQERLLDLHARVAGVAGKVPIAHAVHNPTAIVQVTKGENASLDSLAGAPVLAFCGIGNPEAFFAQLESLGCKLVKRKAFPDHHAYTSGDLAELAEMAAQHSEAKMWLCTEKDSVKLSVAKIGKIPLYKLRIETEFVLGAKAVQEALDRIQELVSPDEDHDADI